MALPDFLVIGAMKAGTTSLYFDLSQHPGVFFPTLKEPGNLAHDEVLTEAGHAVYASLYRRAKPDQRAGDASTDYAKLPDIAGVADRARRVLGPAARIVYLVREPVSRAISHHHHLVARGLAPAEFEAALDVVPALVEYGCYGRQIEPWIDAFGGESILVARLEDYAADRQRAFDIVVRHIGGQPWALRRVDEVGNKTELEPAARGRPAQVRDNRAYRRLLRPLIPEMARRRLRRALLPTPPPRSAPPRLATVQAMVERFEADEQRLRSLLGSATPFWDFAQVTSRAAVSEQARR